VTQDHDPIYDLMRVVDRFADWRADQLAASVIHRLQRMPVTGIFGDDFAYRTVWDEYCHECQFGPHDMLDLAWDATVNPLIAAVLEKVPSEEMALLDSAEAADLRNGDMTTSIRLAITGKAMDRNLDRFARP
jgi:hypothetical protein